MCRLLMQLQAVFCPLAYQRESVAVVRTGAVWLAGCVVSCTAVEAVFTLTVNDVGQLHGKTVLWELFLT